MLEIENELQAEAEILRKLGVPEDEIAKEMDEKRASLGVSAPSASPSKSSHRNRAMQESEDSFSSDESYNYLCDDYISDADTHLPSMGDSFNPPMSIPEDVNENISTPQTPSLSFADESAYCTPRLFVIRSDGSGVELLRETDVALALLAAHRASRVRLVTGLGSSSTSGSAEFDASSADTRTHSLPPQVAGYVLAAVDEPSALIREETVSGIGDEAADAAQSLKVVSDESLADTTSIIPAGNTPEGVAAPQSAVRLTIATLIAAAPAPGQAAVWGMWASAAENARSSRYYSPRISSFVPLGLQIKQHSINEADSLASRPPTLLGGSPLGLIAAMGSTGSGTGAGMRVFALRTILKYHPFTSDDVRRFALGLSNFAAWQRSKAQYERIVQETEKRNRAQKQASLLIASRLAERERMERMKEQRRSRGASRGRDMNMMTTTTESSSLPSGDGNNTTLESDDLTATDRRGSEASGNITSTVTTEASSRKDPYAPPSHRRGPPDYQDSPAPLNTHPLSARMANTSSSSELSGTAAQKTILAGRPNLKTLFYPLNTATIQRTKEINAFQSPSMRELRKLEPGSSSSDAGDVQPERELIGSTFRKGWPSIQSRARSTDRASKSLAEQQTGTHSSRKEMPTIERTPIHEIVRSRRLPVLSPSAISATMTSGLPGSAIAANSSFVHNTQRRSSSASRLNAQNRSAKTIGRLPPMQASAASATMTSRQANQTLSDPTEGHLPPSPLTATPDVVDFGTLCETGKGFIRERVVLTNTDSKPHKFRIAKPDSNIISLSYQPATVCYFFYSLLSQFIPTILLCCSFINFFYYSFLLEWLLHFILSYIRRKHLLMKKSWNLLLLLM